MSGLSVIMPVFNGAGWVGRSLEHLAVAIEAADLDGAEIIVIDDGSTDATAAEAGAAMAAHPSIGFSLLDQANLGRFAARRRGLEVARHDHVLFIDTRVFIHPGALAFVAPRLTSPDQQVWTSHVVAATDGNPLAGFWQAIEHVAWRRYFKQPRTTSFGIDDFDFYPKGTTALIGPRQMFIDAFDAFAPTVADWHKVNDDTAVLRWVAERTPINISPDYSSTYNARTTLSAFLRHAEHRGTVLIDGYLRPGARFAGPIMAVLACTPVGIWFVVRHPIRALALGVVGSTAAGAAARSLGANTHDSRVLGTYAMPFGVAYLSGMWRGVALRVQWWTAHRKAGRSS
jgi:glycosyltransferase involved in cell wall biosynthesis